MSLRTRSGRTIKPVQRFQPTMNDDGTPDWDEDEVKEILDEIDETLTDDGDSEDLRSDDEMFESPGVADDDEEEDDPLEYMSHDEDESSAESSYIETDTEEDDELFEEDPEKDEEELEEEDRARFGMSDEDFDTSDEVSVDGECHLVPQLRTERSIEPHVSPIVEESTDTFETPQIAEPSPPPSDEKQEADLCIVFEAKEKDPTIITSDEEEDGDVVMDEAEPEPVGYGSLTPYKMENGDIDWDKVAREAPHLLPREAPWA